MGDRERMRALFGSDSEEESEDEPAQTGEPEVDSDEGEAALAEHELFGDDDDDDGERGREAPAIPSAPPVHYELPDLPRPAADSKNLYLVRMPNILQIEPRPYDTASYTRALQDEADEDDEGTKRTENVVRWREREGGERQSNARIVNWSDGSMTLHVGSEVLAASSQKLAEGTTQLWARHKGSSLECHAVLPMKLSFRPASIQSSTHKALTEHIAKAHVKERKIKITNTSTDPELAKRDAERSWNEKNRLQSRQAARAMRDRERGPELSADFLDAEDDWDLEGNLGAIKKRFKEGKGAGSSGGKRRAGATTRRRYRGRADDEFDEEEDDEREWDREERIAREAGEMDGFIVDDEGEADSDEFGDWDEEDDDDWESRPPKKKGRAGR